MPYAKSRQTRQRLLDATAGLLRTRGYAATGMSDIIDASGVAKGSVYHQYRGGKEELAAASLRHSGGSIRMFLEDLLARTGGPVQAVAAFCDYYAGQLTGSGFRRGCPLATVALEAAPEVDALHRALSEAFAGISDLLARELAAAGLPAAAARRLATFTVSAIEGALILAKAQRSTDALAQVRDELLPLLEDRIALHGGSVDGRP